MIKKKHLFVTSESVVIYSFLVKLKISALILVVVPNFVCITGIGILEPFYWKKKKLVKKGWFLVIQGQNSCTDHVIGRDQEVEPHL